MTSATIGNLNARLGLDTAEFTAGLAGARSSLSSFSTTLKTFAATASIGMLGSLGVTALKQAAQIGDLAETIGVTAEQIQVYNRMAIASGTSSESMAKGLQTIAEQAVDANSALSKLFKANGLDAKVMSVNEQIRTFMDLLKNARTPSEQLAIAVEVLGKRVGRALIEAMRDGAAGYDKMQDDMIASGERMSNAEIKRLQDLETQYNLVIDRIGQYWMKMVTAAVQAGDRIVETFLEPNAVSAGREAYFKRRGTSFGPSTGGAARITGPAYDPLSSVAVPVIVTKMPEDKSGKTTKTKDVPDWMGKTKGVSENPMQEGAITGYDIRGNGLEISGLTDTFNEAQDAAESLAQSITESIGDALAGMAAGTMSVKEGFASMAQSMISDLGDIAAQLLKSGLLKLLLGMGTSIGGAQGLFGMFGGFYADGGHLGAGRWGIAGEAGPEIVEGPATIRPMGQGGGSTTVNVYNRGGGDVQQSRRRDGQGREIVDIVVGITREEQAKGSKRLLGGGFGVQPSLTQR